MRLKNSTYRRRGFRYTAAALAVAISGTALASSHREAPFISHQPSVDGTDLYMFRSYEPGRSGFVTAIANYIPFQDPQGGPIFYPFNENALYEIHFDNNGDGREDITFQFRFTNTSKGASLPVGGQNVRIPLIYSGPVSGVNPPTLNRRETYTVEVVRGDRRSGTRSGRVTNATGGANVFDKPLDYVGEKTLGAPAAYDAYAALHTYDIAIPGCANGRMFVGQRKEPFFIAVGDIFDLFNYDPLGSETGKNNDLEFKNISSIALELPITCLTASDPVIGAFTTASLRQGRLLDPSPGTSINGVVKSGGAWTQISRVGMPLVNEVVIGLDDKDKFNASKPRNDAQFLQYVTNPTLPTLVQSLFPGVTAPTNFPRTDLVAAFLTGLVGVNRPANVVPSELMRLNTSTPATPLASQSPLGVAGMDAAGFPNGRRPGDDVVDVTLRVAMGALCVLTGPTDTLGVGCGPAVAPSGGQPFTDGVRRNATNFRPAFPYFNTPIPGSFN
ncbi:MAG TPA: DUF4331 domain-containing protein [Burkholderiaceae bacterium]|nr:DUF4331 domain-containing protein [Burkholderiaceae bacterium]